MKIKAIYENAEGQHELSAILSNEQVKFLLEFALLEILRKGLMVPMVDNDAVTLIEFGKLNKEEADVEDINSTGRAS